MPLPPGSLLLPYARRLDMVLQTFVLLVPYFSSVRLAPFLCNCLSGTIVFRHWISVTLVSSQGFLRLRDLPQAAGLSQVGVRTGSPRSRAAGGQGQDQGNATSGRPVRLKSGREQREEASARHNCVLGKRGVEGAWLSRTAMCCPVPSVTGVRSCEEWDLRQTPPGVGWALLLAASWRRESPGKLWNAPCSCTARRPQRGALIHTSSLT